MSDKATAYFRDKLDDPATPEDETGDGSEIYQVEAKGHVRVDREDQTGTPTISPTIPTPRSPS